MLILSRNYDCKLATTFAKPHPEKCLFALLVKGYLIIPGRVSRKYFEERFYGVEQDTVKEERHASE